MRLRRRVDGPVQPWGALVTSPVIRFDVAAPTGVTLAAFERGLRYRPFRGFRTHRDAQRVEGRRVHWFSKAADVLFLPGRHVVVVEVVPDVPGQVRFTQPKGHSDLVSARRAAQCLGTAVTELRGSGVTVTVHEWDSLDPWTAERLAKKRRRQG